MSKSRAGPNRTPMQLAAQHHYISRQISVGNYANVYFSIPKTVANQILSAFDSKTIDQNEAISRLRAGLQAIKISKGKTGDTADNMDMEVAVLQHMSELNHPNLVRLQGADAAVNNKVWYTLELLTGTTFGGYCTVFQDLGRNHIETPAPKAFGWHLVLQLTEALLALHFGDKDGQQSNSWPMYSHNDIHQHNMLFRNALGDFGNYPDVVLIDFGRVQKLGGLTDRAAFFETQHTNMKRVVSSVADYGFGSVQALQDLSGEIRDLDIQKGVDDNRILKQWMRELRTRAIRERDRLYEPLHPDIVKHFEVQKTMSDVELWQQSNGKRSVE